MIFVRSAKITVFDVFEGLDPFRDLLQPQRHQAKLPKAVPRPKKVTKTPKTQNPEKPSEGGLSLGGEGVMGKFLLVKLEGSTNKNLFFSSF